MPLTVYIFVVYHRVKSVCLFVGAAVLDVIGDVNVMAFLVQSRVRTPCSKVHDITASNTPKVGGLA